ncbi:MAG: sensor histidine kinase, partial [Anaerolineales bacterium]
RLTKVVVNSRHLLELINDVLDLSKINAGQMELAYSSMDVKAVLSDAVSALAPLAEDKALALTLDAPAQLSIQADAPRLRQVFINLIGNAIKFTENGSITVTARRTDDLLRVSVQDTGIGIAPEHQHVIFDEFRQADGGSTRRYQGTGLGLAISKRIVDMHGGSIDVQSAPGEGSTFTVVLPVLPTPAPLVAEAATPT